MIIIAAACASITGDACHFHYLIADGVCYLALAPKSYPGRLAHHYLEKVHTLFEGHLRKAHGDNGWRREVETVARPYAFIKFDKVISSMRREFQDPHSRDNMTKLNRELSEVRHIMQQNIKDVLDRGEKLDHVADMSNKLVDQSKNFRWGAKRLNLMAMYRQYAPFLAIGFVVSSLVYVKFFTTWW